VRARRRAEAAARELERIDQRKTEFIAMSAHELRNPLAPIRSALEVMSRARHDEPLRDRTVSLMKRQVGQMVRLVEDLFDISRIGHDKLSLNRVPVDLASVIHNAAEASAPLFDDAGVVYSAVLPPASVYVEADAGRLAQVIGNVLNNAAKFTPPGGSVALRLTRTADEAAITIRDTGIGLEPD